MARLILLIVVVFTAVGLADDEPGPGKHTKPPWQRVLQGEAVKMAEVLEKRIDAAEKADRYDDAIRAASELLELRKELQGEDHWETISQR